MNKILRISIVAIVLLLLLRLWGLPPFSSSEKYPENAILGAVEAAYSDVYKQVTAGEVEKLEYQQGSRQVIAHLGEGKMVFTHLPPDSDIIKAANEAGVRVEVQAPNPPTWWERNGMWITILLPVGLLGGIILYVHFSNRAQQQQALRGLRPDKSGFKGTTMIDPDKNKTRLTDVAGNEQAKNEVVEIIQFLKDPTQYTNLGARMPRGVLMSGPPGTGKTLLAKAIAGEAGVPFFSVSGSDFVEVFVGVGASRVRTLFEMAKKNSPSIIFIDEIDSIGRSRSSGGQQENSERESTLISILTEMDGFDTDSGVVVIAATNRPDVLDEALTRPGRFDREVSMSLPDKNERVDILKVHTRNIPIAAGVDLERVAMGSIGFSGADLANLVNEAAVMAARENVKLVEMRHFEQARDKIIMGVARSPLQNQEERRVIAVHEAGHAIVARFTEGAEPVHKISIVPRGRALGVTVQLPREDTYNHSQARLEGDIAVLMGGRAAEDLVIGRRTTGASNDFMRATVMARRMICSWGMDPDFGPLSIDGERGNEYAATTVWSEAIKEEADRKVQKLVRERYATAYNLLAAHRGALDAITQALLEHETVDADLFEELVRKAEGLPPLEYKPQQEENPATLSPVHHSDQDLAWPEGRDPDKQN